MPYIGRSTEAFGVRSRFTFLASADDTSVSGNDVNGLPLKFEDGAYVDVFLNGVKLKSGTDYVTTTANTISSLSALAANDEVEVVVFDVFTLADMVSKANGGNFEGRVGFNGGIGGSGGALTLKNTDTSDDSFPIITLQTGDTDIAQSDVLGRILFQAPDEGTGTDAITSSARIQALSEGDFSSSNNATSIEFRTATSGVVGTAAQGSRLTLQSDANLLLKDMDTADGSSPTITLQTGDTDIAQDDVLGSINFQAPDEGTGTDAILVAAGIAAVSEGDFSSSSNATKLSFKTGASEAAAEKMSLSSAGNLTVSGDVSVGDDLSLASDSAVLKFGSDSEITVTHVADTGLNIKHTATGDDKPVVLTLQTGETDIAQDDVLGKIQFQAPDEGTGTDAILVAAGIQAVSEGDFSSSSNATALHFLTGASEAASSKMHLGSGGDLSLSTDGASIFFGASSEIELRHVADDGLILKHVGTGDGKEPSLTFQAGDNDIAQDDVLGSIFFQAPDEGAGTDAVLVAAGIEAVSEGDFSSSSNATSLIFKTGASEAAAEKMRVTSGGQLLIGTTSSDFDDGADNLIVGSGSGDNGITIFTGSSVGDKGSIFFADATTGSNAEKKGQISYEQNNEIMTFFTNHTLAQQIDASGHVTKPRNPAFHVTGSTQTNINHNVDFYPQRGSSGAVIYDVGSDITLSDNISFSPSDVNYFVAPVTGKYAFEFRARFDNMPADITYVASTLYTSNRQHGINMHSTNWMDATASYYSHQGTIIADLDANDTAYVVLYLAGGTTGTDLNSHSFKGVLIG